MSNGLADPGARPWPPSPGGEPSARRQAALLARFTAAGYRPIETAILSPSSIFLDFSGEAIRSRLFLTGDGSGTELCLRPEYTIPVCRAYLAAGGGRAAFCYCGPVFRSGDGGDGQSLQSGIESFGREDIASADAEILMLSLEAAADAGLVRPTVRMGDAGLLARVFEVLQVPPMWQRRLKRALDKGQPLAAALADPPAAGHDHSGVIAALTGTDQTGARALVEDLLSIAGIATVGGRSAAEIAERFLSQVASRATPAFGIEQREMLGRFLSIEAHPDEASRQLRALAAETRLDLGAALDLFDERANFIAAHGLSAERLLFDAAFGRNLDYYTGFTFEARSAEAARHGPAEDVVIGGGRYDRLAEALGSATPVAAIGASVWVDRIATADGAAHG